VQAPQSSTTTTVEPCSAHGVPLEVEEPEVELEEPEEEADRERGATTAVDNEATIAVDGSTTSASRLPPCPPWATG